LGWLYTTRRLFWVKSIESLLKLTGHFSPVSGDSEFGYRGSSKVISSNLEILK
jgi:hypothetical protein